VTAPAGTVLIHGAGMGAWVWDRVIPLLDRPALAVDLPGRGARPADPRTSTLADATRSVLDDVARFDHARVGVVGHSLGGVVALAVAASLGERVEEIVLIAAPVPDDGKPFPSALPPVQRLMLRAVVRASPKGPRIPRFAARRSLCNDLDDATTEMVTSQLVREPGRV
jgi:pimeloyl-ACP methyl ester carboxylesterase